MSLIRANTSITPVEGDIHIRKSTQNGSDTHEDSHLALPFVTARGAIITGETHKSHLSQSAPCDVNEGCDHSWFYDISVEAEGARNFVSWSHRPRIDPILLRSVYNCRLKLAE